MVWFWVSLLGHVTLKIGKLDDLINKSYVPLQFYSQAV